MNQVDLNDLEFAKKRGFDPIGWRMPIDSATGKINPHVTQFFDGSNTTLSVFHIKPIYYEALDGSWRPLSEVASYTGNHKVVMEGWDKVHPRYISWLHKRMKLINGELLIPTMIPTNIETIVSLQYARTGHVGLTTTTVYPDPNPETTTVDGHSSVYYRTSVWDTEHDASSGNNLTDSDTTFVVGYLRTDAGARLGILRWFLLFDTSAIGDTDTISSAVMSLYVTSKIVRNYDATSVLVAGVTPASNTALVADDYDQCGAINNPTEGASRFDAYTDWTTSAYNDITLNSTGIGVVSKTGVTKLGIRHKDDADDTNPGTGLLADQTIASSADASGTSQDPKLVVEHTAGATATVKQPKRHIFWW